MGGTKTLLQKGDRIERFVSKDYPSFEAILEEFGEPFDKACIGVAGPVIDNQCKVTNLPWTVASNTTMTFINDLVAMAYGIPYATQECVYTGTGWGNKALIAPGTGLGEALIINGVPISSEGGHADFAPQTDRDIALYQRLRNQGHVSWETVLHEGGALLQDDAWFFE